LNWMVIYPTFYPTIPTATPAGV